MKTMKDEMYNNVAVCGKLLSLSSTAGKTTDGRPWEKATAVVRVNQTFDGNTETSEIILPFMAMQYTREGKVSATYENIQRLKKMKTAQNDGIEEASVISVSKSSSGRPCGRISENFFMTKSGRFVDDWQLDCQFASLVTGKTVEQAGVEVDAFILNMTDEMNKDEELTGRLIIKAGIVGYGEKLSVINFIVEAPDKVDFIRNNWAVNDTVRITARVRSTRVETTETKPVSSWGETITNTVIRTVRELIVTGGSNAPYEEEFAYDPVEIKKGFNVRKAQIEQRQNASPAPAKKATATSAPKSYDWEE